MLNSAPHVVRGAPPILFRTATPFRRTTTATISRRFSSEAVAGGGGGTPYVPPPRGNVSKAERAALRQARREQAARLVQAAQGGGGEGAATAEGVGGASGATGATGGGGGGGVRVDSRILYGVGIGVPTALLAWGYNDENSPPGKFSKMIGLTDVLKSFTDSYALPSHDRLLPNWQDMPNVPHDIPVPHTLVLDLEDTLVSSSWDRKHGWRYAKRPGVDKFLHDLAQYYEIVLYSPSLEGVADPVVNTLDKSGCILHRLYREKTHFINGVHVKDLNRLNRNVKRIVAIDDDAEALQLNPGNLIRVKPYTDPTDREDRTLARITPLLIEIAREGYDDIPALLSQFEGMDADELADEHERRIRDLQQSRRDRARKGLGSLAVRGKELPPPELEPEPEWAAAAAAAVPQTPSLTSKEIVGEGPPVQETGVVGWLNRRNKEKQEEQMRKMEKWNEVMMKKQMEKKEREERASKGRV